MTHELNSLVCFRAVWTTWWPDVMIPLNCGDVRDPGRRGAGAQRRHALGALVNEWRAKTATRESPDIMLEPLPAGGS